MQVCVRLCRLQQYSTGFYIIINCKSTPGIFRIQNPAKALNFELKTKGLQYFLPVNVWKSKIIPYVCSQILFVYVFVEVIIM